MHLGPEIRVSLERRRGQEERFGENRPRRARGHPGVGGRPPPASRSQAHEFERGQRRQRVEVAGSLERQSTPPGVDALLDPGQEP